MEDIKKKVFEYLNGRFRAGLLTTIDIEFIAKDFKLSRQKATALFRKWSDQKRKKETDGGNNA